MKKEHTVKKQIQDKKIIKSSQHNDYIHFLDEVKSKIQVAQVKANLAVNRELILLYWNIGRLINEKQRLEGWGAKIIKRLARDIRNELPEVKGFSVRNINYMCAYAKEYNLSQFVQQPVAQLPPIKNSEAQKVNYIKEISAQLAALSLKIPWGHNILLFQKINETEKRLWYMQQIVSYGWSRSILQIHIKNNHYERKGNAITNFEQTLPAPQSDLAQQALKDPYIFDFLTLDTKFKERELETDLVRHLQDFLIELGVGFAFVGRQYHVALDDSDFYIDLLFYHLKLRSYFVIELKRGPFKPEYAGKMNFYLNVIDAKLRHPDDKPSIGLILCEDKNRIVAEYALRGMDKAIGISEYELTRALPDKIKSELPSIAEIEAELQADLDRKTKK